MKRAFSLALLPLAGCVLVLVGLAFGGRDLRLRLAGESTPAQVAGMIVARADGSADLITGATTTLVLTTAAGERYEFGARDYRPPERGGDAPQTPEFRRVLEESIRGDAAVIRWALRREERRKDDPSRVVTIEKTERLSGYFGLPAAPARVRVGADGLAPAGDTLATAAPAEARVTAIFDRSDRDALTANRGESLRSFSYERPGFAGEPAKRNFYLQAEPYSTVFRPVYRYAFAGSDHANISTVGRQGGPTLALRLFGPALVYLEPAEPSRGVLFADPGRPDGKLLDWFSRVCEGIFAQWGASAMIVVAGGCVSAAGLLAASLALLPSKRLN